MNFKAAGTKSAMFLISALLFFTFSLTVFTTRVNAADIQFPKYNGLVNDYEGIIDNDATLEQKLQNFRSETSVEIAVVTIKDFQGTYLEDYAVKLFAAWGIGQKGKDNGILILVSKSQRQTRIEVGYGLEGTVPDITAGRIQDEYMIPDFQKGDYTSGVNKAVDALIGYIKKDQAVIFALDSKSNDSAPQLTAFQTVILVIVMVIVFILLTRTSLGQILLWLLISSARGGRGGFGGSSGGGFSFGGGRSGGGGSSRSW